MSFGNIVALLLIPTAPLKRVTLYASDKQVRKNQNLICFYTYFQISNNINITTVVYAEISQQHLNKIALNYVQLCLSVQLFTTNRHKASLSVCYNIIGRLEGCPQCDSQC